MSKRRMKYFQLTLIVCLVIYAFFLFTLVEEKNAFLPTLTIASTLHRMAVQKDPKRLFGCASNHLYSHSYGITLATDIFPEMDKTIIPLMNDDDIKSRGATGDDLLVYFMHSCPNLDPNNFPGKTIVVSGESKLGFPCAMTEADRVLNKLCAPDMPTGPRIYWIGPNDDSLRSILVHWGILLLNARMRPMDEDEFSFIFDPLKKRKNTGEHFLIYANSHCVPHREMAFDALSKIGESHYLGVCSGLKSEIQNKKPSPFPMDKNIGTLMNSRSFNHYRFALVMESVDSSSAALTEKIFNAFLSGAIPIYFGNRAVWEIFNEKAFIWFDPQKPDPALKTVSFLENNPVAYQTMLAEPILKHGNHTIEMFFSFRDEIGHGMLKTRIRTMMGYEI